MNKEKEASEKIISEELNSGDPLGEKTTAEPSDINVSSENISTPVNQDHTPESKDEAMEEAAITNEKTENSSVEETVANTSQEIADTESPANEKEENLTEKVALDVSDPASEDEPKSDDFEAETDSKEILAQEEEVENGEVVEGNSPEENQIVQQSQVAQTELPSDESETETKNNSVAEPENKPEAEADEMEEKADQTTAQIEEEGNAELQNADSEQGSEEMPGPEQSIENDLNKAEHPDNKSTETEAVIEKEDQPSDKEIPGETVVDETEANHSIAEDNKPQHDNNEEDQHNEEKESTPESDDELLNADFSTYSKEELVKVIEKLTKEDSFKRIDAILKLIYPVYSALRDEDRKHAFDKFIEDGGEKDGFDYKDELNDRYEASFRLIKDKKSKYYNTLEKQKVENYEKATQTLEKLRDLVDNEENTASISAIKELQSEWKSIGQVPAQYTKNLWASYNALMDRFYDNRSIYFELKELDRKKNLIAKQKLCERAEKLVEVENLKNAIKELNELHEEYKHIGPIPKNDQESTWTRFKAASDKIYARRKDYYDLLKKDLEENYIAKSKLKEQVLSFADFTSDRIVEWNKKTQEILELQKLWEAIGSLPREKAREVNKPFWTTFKTFFNNKNQFFKKLEGERDNNLKLKQELVDKAVELKESVDWEKAANELKKLQADWKNIGPVPEKLRKEVYQKFKEACDHFFERRRGRFKETEKEYEKNLNIKNEICDKIVKLAEDGSNDTEQLEVLQNQWNAVGFVPKNAIRSSQEKFNGAVDRFIKSSGLSEDDKSKLKVTTQLNSLKGTPNSERKLNKKEFSLRKQISNIENDITLWKNNLEFFAASKNADQVREEFDQKILNAQNQLKELKNQLKIIKQI